MTRQEIIAMIEFPALEQTVARELGRRNIPFVFRTSKAKNLLTVQIIGEYFFDIPVTLDNVNRTMGLMQYFLLRPECALKEMPGIRVRRDYGLAKTWGKK